MGLQDAQHVFVMCSRQCGWHTQGPQFVALWERRGYFGPCILSAYWACLSEVHWCAYSYPDGPSQPRVYTMSLGLYSAATAVRVETIPSSPYPSCFNVFRIALLNYSRSI